jgi:hypothetical protein
VTDGPADGSSNPEPRMIGDFNSSSGELWAFFGKEAKSQDETRIQTPKEDMDGVLIFVCLCFVHAYGLSHADSWQHRLVYFLRPSLHS